MNLIRRGIADLDNLCRDIPEGEKAEVLKLVKSTHKKLKAMIRR